MSRADEQWLGRLFDAYGCMGLGYDKDMQFDDASLARWKNEPAS